MRRLGIATGLLLLTVSSFAWAQQAPVYQTSMWSGFSVGAGVGGAFGNAHSDVSGSISTSSAFGSIYGSYDFQFPNGLVLGLQAGISPLPGLFGNANRACPASLCGGLPATNNYRVQVNWFADIRPRIGFAIGRFLPYATAGFGFGEGQSTVTTSLLGQILGSQVIHSNLRGAVFGAGLQYAVTSHLSADFAYLRLQAGASGVPGGGLASNAFRIGADYRF